MNINDGSKRGRWVWVVPTHGQPPLVADSPELISMGSVTRIHVVTEGDSPEYWADSWQLSHQDDGKTIKLFASGDGRKAREERDRALASDLAQHPIPEPLRGLPGPDEARWSPEGTRRSGLWTDEDVEYRSWKLRQIDAVVTRHSPDRAAEATRQILRLRDEDVREHIANGTSHQLAQPQDGRELH